MKLLKVICILGNSLILFNSYSFAQSFSFQLTGNPVNITGWQMGAQSHVANDEVILTDNTFNQAGYIYFSTPQNLANCSRFTVRFDFRITNSSALTADGLAFFYITNPPSSFAIGQGIGLPNDPNGLLLILDTYNNDALPDNPLVSLRKLDGTSNYVEGTNTGQLTSDLINQKFIADGNWHTCELVYAYGTVMVSFDHNPPVMTGNTTLNINGYFGFCASTGASYATHAIRNVSIQGGIEPDPPLGDSVFYCQNEVAMPLTALPASNLKWYDMPVGGSPLPEAPIPATTTPGVFTWYVSQEIPDCNLESKRTPVVVTVRALPSVPTFKVPAFCSGKPDLPLVILSGQNIKWYDQPTGGTGLSTFPGVNTNNPDTLVWFATQTDSFGCESPRTSIPIVIHRSPEADFSFIYHLGCEEDTIDFQNKSLYANAYFWDFNDGENSILANPQHNYFTAGTFHVSLVARNTYCTDTVIMPVTIGHPLEAAFTSSADTVCEGTLVSFTNGSIATVINGIDPSYVWDFGDGHTADGINAAHGFDLPGLYSVRLIAQNSIPCYDTAYKTILVDSLPWLMLIPDDSVICEGTSVTFKAVAAQDGLKSLLWNFGDAFDTVFNDNPVQHAFDHAGIYQVSLHGQYRICPDTTSRMQLKVNPMPVVSLGQDTSLCLDDAPLVVEDIHNKDNPAAYWLWSTGDTTAALTVRHGGLYKCRVTIDGCSTTDEISIKKDCYIDVPNAFTPNGDSENDYFFPRQLLSRSVVSFKMNVYNRWGESIFETTKTGGRGWDGKFNGKDQPMGVYVYQMKVTYKNGRQEAYTGNVTLIR